MSIFDYITIPVRRVQNFQRMFVQKEKNFYICIPQKRGFKASIRCTLL